MENIRKKFAKQLKEALIAAGYEPKPAVLEREFNLRYWGKPVSLHGVRRWLFGETLPTEDKLLVLSEWLNISLEYLVHGTTNTIKEKDSLYGVTPADRDIISAYLALPLEQRKLVAAIIQAFIAAQGATA